VTRFQKISLGIAGITAFSIGAFILIAPQAFYAGYGIVLGPDPSLLSEMRAPGAGLAALGTIMLAGLFRAAVAPVALAASMTVYIAFPVGRLVSLAVDGMPSSSVIGALVIEVVIAGLLLAAFRRRAGDTIGNALASEAG
jgi:hypothetical protein